MTIFFFVLLSGSIHSESKIVNRKNIYNPKLDVQTEVKNAIHVGKDQNKMVLLMFGANWCPWCHRLHQLFSENQTVHNFIKKHFIIVMIDIGEKSDKPLNRDLVKKSRVEGFGYPALAVIDTRSGKLQSAQSTGILEKGKGYNTKKVLAYLRSQISE